MITVRLLTPKGEYLSTEASLVVAPGSAGQLGILQSHESLMSPLKNGELHINTTAGRRTFKIARGFIDVSTPSLEAGTSVTVLAESFE